MMSSPFSPSNILALIIISLFLFVDAEAVKEHESQKLMIRGLNLSPRTDVNIVEDDHLVNASKIVEKRFRFPSLITATSTGRTDVAGFAQHAGYYSLPNTTKGPARWFYYFFESRNEDLGAPVVVWLTGGPGCSSSIALFYENGPLHLTHNLSLVWNDYGWDQASNLIYVDQPTGTGFSYTSDKDDIRIGSDEAGVDFYEFLQAFFKDHPEYATNDLYLTGDAGHYIPAFATQIHRKNKNNTGLHINLKGLAIGNGMTNPEIQYGAYVDYLDDAYSRKLINQSLYNQSHDLVGKVSDCQQKVQEDCVGTNCSKSCERAYLLCNKILSEILRSSSNAGVNYYDIRKKYEGDLYNLSNMEYFLNQSSVKTTLGVPSNIGFVSCSSAVHEAMLGDEMLNFAIDIPELLEDEIKLLVYAGEYDLICNWLGNKRWVDKMTWSGQESFLGARNVAFNVDGVEAGKLTSYGALSFLRVYNAGHVVPMDQPKAALEMLIKWINGSLPSEL